MNEVKVYPEVEAENDQYDCVSVDDDLFASTLTSRYTIVLNFLNVTHHLLGVLHLLSLKFSTYLFKLY